MNEKTRDPKTLAAIREDWAISRSRMPELLESAAGVESFPSFTKPARERWQSIPADLRQRLLSNVWCGQCGNETAITHFSGTISDGNLLLEGACAECRGEVARVIEDS